MVHLALRARSALAGAGVVVLLTGCAEEAPPDAGNPVLRLPADSLVVTLAGALGGPAYRVDSAPVAGGRISGVVRYDGALAADTLTRPTHDLGICQPRPDAPIRGSADGLGDVLVWLVGVTHGPADAASRRVSLALEGCELQPRISRAPVGATLLVRSADEMDARLRFLSATVPAHDDTAGVFTSGVPRALVPLGMAGTVVPVTDALSVPGLVEVRDDRHPWVRAWIAVAPHPFVAVTDGNGGFEFRDVPPGTYALVAWHERLGRVALPVFVESGVEARVAVVIPPG